MTKSNPQGRFYVFVFAITVSVMYLIVWVVETGKFPQAALEDLFRRMDSAQPRSPIQEPRAVPEVDASEKHPQGAATVSQWAKRAKVFLYIAGSAGVFKFTTLIGMFLMTRIPLFKRFIFGSYFIEGTWVGFFGAIQDP